MKIKTSSGNTYWYDYISNEISVHTGQEEIIPPCVNYLKVPDYKVLPVLEHFILEITRDCNLRCSYCCYSGRYAMHRRHENRSMDAGMIDHVIAFIEKVRNHQRKLTFSMYGGEPFLCPDMIRYTIQQCKMVFPQDTVYTISTNSVLLDEKMLLYCVENGVILNVSIDGAPFIHDRYRRDKLGMPTYEVVHNRLSLIKKAYPQYWKEHVRLFVTLDSLSQLEEIAQYWGDDDVLRQKAPTAISTIAPNYDKKNYNKTVERRNEIDAIMSLLFYYERNRENQFCAGFFERFVYEIVNRKIYNIPSSIYPIVCLPENHRCFIDVYGNIGICEKVCDTLRFGNIIKGIDMEAVNDIVQEHVAIKKRRCVNCWAFRLCKTCFTNYGYSEEAWDEDCNNSRLLVYWQLLITLELAERQMLSNDVEAHLRKLIPKDINSIKRIMSEDNVIRYMDYLSNCQTEEGATMLYELLTNENVSDDRSVMVYGIADDDNMLIGVVGVDTVENQLGNLFFCLDENYWGQGIMTAAMSMFLLSFQKSGIKPYARISKENHRALNLMKKFSSVDVEIVDA